MVAKGKKCRLNQKSKENFFGKTILKLQKNGLLSMVVNLNLKRRRENNG